MLGLSCWGDSLTAGAGLMQRLTLAAYPYQLQMKYGLKRKIHHRGAARETSGQILRRFESEPQRWDDTSIIWMGRNNSSEPDDVERDLAKMVSQLPHSRYLILTIINSTKETIGTDWYEVQMRVNRDILSRYPDHTLDIRSKLIEASGGADDSINRTWTIDGLHLTRRSMGFIAEAVKSECDLRGW